MSTKDDSEPTNATEAPIRVIRILEYVGAPDAVKAQIADSIQGCRVVRASESEEGVTITAATLEATDVSAAVTAALRAARFEHAHYVALVINACTALNWPTPRTASEMSNGALFARAALRRDEPPHDWMPYRGASSVFPRTPEQTNTDANNRWSLFRDKVRELAMKAQIVEGAAK